MYQPALVDLTVIALRTELPIRASAGSEPMKKRDRQQMTPITTKERTMKRFIALLAAFTAMLVIAVPAFAGHDSNPSDRVASYTYDLGELNDSGVEGTVRIKALPNGKLQVKVDASGLLANAPHAQHLHGLTNGVATQCPPSDSQIPFTTVDGIPFYGGIQASLTTSGDTSAASALSIPRFPVADAEGNLQYSRTFEVSSEVHAAAGTLQYVVHGVDLNGSGVYDGSALSSIPAAASLGVPLEVTIPAACGGVNN